MISKALKLIAGHKIIVGLAIIILVGGGYFGYKKVSGPKADVQYLTAKVEKGMLVSSVSGTGQVSALNQVEVKPKVSGDIILVKVVKGQEVKEGDLIAQIDSRDAAQKVNEAAVNLENAELELEELLFPSDTLTLMQAENAVIDAKNSLAKLKTTQADNREEALKKKEKAEDDLSSAYEDAYNDIANTFLDLPTIMTGIYTILYSNEIADSETTVTPASNYSALINSFVGGEYNKRIKMESYVDNAKNYYEKAKENYDKNFDNFKDANRH